MHFVTYTVDSNSDPVAGTQLDCSGIVSGGSITSLSVIDGNDTGNAVGDKVEMLPTAAWGQDLADALTNQHSRVGAHVGVTNTGGMTTDTLAVSGATTHTGATTLTGAVGGTGYSMATMSNPYKFSVYRNAAVNSTTSAAVLVYDTKTFDTGSNYSTSTGLFTAPVAGFYFFDAAYTTSSGSNASLNIQLFQNSTKIADVNGTLTTAIQSVQAVAVSKLLQLAANDTVSIKILNGTGTLTVTTGNASTWFDGFLISAA